MLEELFKSVVTYSTKIFNEVTLTLSVVLGLILNALGYPKDILSIILMFCVCDILTKWYALIKSNYGEFTICNFFRGWRDRVLNSRAWKEGIGVKLFIYVPLLILANKLPHMKEVIIGDEVSKIIYTGVALIEIRSMLENAEDAGFKRIAPFVDFFKDKINLIFGKGDGGNDVQN